MCFLLLWSSDRQLPLLALWDSPSSNLSESQPHAITCHPSPSGSHCGLHVNHKTPRCGDEKAFDTQILKVDATLYSGTIHTLTVYVAVMYRWVSGCRGPTKSHEAVLLCLALFSVCSASDRKTAMNHWLSQLEKKPPQWMDTSFYAKKINMMLTCSGCSGAVCWSKGTAQEEMCVHFYDNR